MNEEEILKRAIATYGNLQKVVAMEEMSELIKELSKDLRHEGDKKHIAEEIADVDIMLEQLRLIYNCEREIATWRRYKLERLSIALKYADGNETI